MGVRAHDRGSRPLEIARLPRRLVASFTHCLCSGPAASTTTVDSVIVYVYVCANVSKDPCGECVRTSGKLVEFPRHTMSESQETVKNRAFVATRAKFLVDEIPKIADNPIPTDLTGIDPTSPAAGMYWALNTLQTLVDKRWPASLVSDSEKGTDRRLVRSVGLCMIGCPEVVMEFHIQESDAAMGIFTDLVHMAMGNAALACEQKFIPGRGVNAFRYKRKYVIHDAMHTCKCHVCTATEPMGNDWPRPEDTNSSPLWALLNEVIPHFRGIQICLAPDEQREKDPHFAYCALCDTQLPERHKLCPCKAVAYCDQTCQKKHWRVHKVMCATQNCLEAQLKTGVVKQGSL